jgi:hypothetical protein
MLNEQDLLLLLNLIAKAEGITIGYSSDPDVARVQAKLSMMLEIKRRVSRPWREDQDTSQAEAVLESGDASR